MANKVLDLLLKLTVQGGGDAEKLKAAIDSVTKSAQNLRGMAKLDEILAGGKAKKDVEDVFTAFQRLAAEIRRVGSIKIVDFDPTLGKVDLLVTKTRQFIDLVANSGRQKIDLNLGTASREIDLVTQKARQLFDLVVTRGKLRIDFDLTKIEREAAKANAALRSLQAQTNKTAVSFQQAQRHSEGLGRAIGDVASSALFFRRAFVVLTASLGLRELLEVVKAFDSVRQSLRAVFGEADAAEQFAFIRLEAERLGISITALGQDYAKFSIAARSLGLTQAEIQDVFLATAEAGATLALSSDQVSGALTALQQIASKGRLSMEELRQQLGDRLPGAIAIAAKAMGVTEARLFAMVEQGQVASDVFLRQFPAALRASFGTDASTRIETTAASIQRFKNAVSEALDAAVRAGALQAFTDILLDLSKILKDQGFIDGLKTFSKGVLSFITFVRENIGPIATFVGLLAGFKLFSSIAVGLTRLASGFSALSAAASPAAKGVALAAVGIKDVALTAEGAVPKVTGLASAIGSLALATKNPIILVIAGLAALDAALIEAFIAKMEKLRDKQAELAESSRELAKTARLETVFKQQADALDEFNGAVALSIEAVNSLSEDGLRAYLQVAEGAKKLADVQVKAANNAIQAAKEELKQIELSGIATDEFLRRKIQLNAAIEEGTKQQEVASASSARFAKSLEAVNQRVTEQSIALDPFVQHLRRLADQLIFTDGKLNDIAKNKLTFAALNKDTQALVINFRKLQEEGKSVADSFEKMIPKNFSDLGIKEITNIGNALAFLIQQGEVAAVTVGENLAKALDKLNASALQKFGVQAQAAFELARLSADGLAVLLDGQLRAALKNMGLEADTAGKKVSKTFKELIDNLAIIAQNAQVTGDQLKGALDVAIQAAKTKEELEALKATLDQLGVASGVFGDALQDSLLRLDDALRIASGKIDSALGDSFKRLGVTAKQELKAIADQAVVDFDRIKASGQATALELEAAWRKMAEEVTRLNNGIPPINILINAVDFNAFDLIVKAAEDASARTRKAIENAIPLVETTKQAKALGDAIVEAFDKGKISADEFGKLITEVGFKMRELAAKPVGELAASAELLGLKTKDQLKAIADNAKEAFSNVLSSGQFTNDELAKGAQQFLDAYMAANDGVVDSFDPVVAAAQEVLDSVNKNINALDKLQAKAKNFSIDIGNLNEMSVAQLQELLSSTIKAYQQLGVGNLEQLQIVKEINAELQERAKDSAEKMKDAFEKSAEKLNDSADKLGEAMTQPMKPAPGGGESGRFRDTQPIAQPVVNNFNFNNATTTPDAVKREVLPVINSIQQRRR